LRRSLFSVCSVGDCGALGGQLGIRARCASTCRPSLAFWRWSIALIILTPFAYAHVRRQWRVIAGSWRVLGSLALLATVFQHIPVYIGLRETTATTPEPI
jgi:hypothetical protein